MAITPVIEHHFDTHPEWVETSQRLGWCAAVAEG